MNNPPRVFLVDDQPAVLKAVSRLLDLAGFEALTFKSAEAFLESGNAGEPGCLVLDLTMPGMNGMTLQQALAECASALPIIFLTGNGDIDTSVQAMKLGAADFLTKPVHSAKLLAAVRAAFEKNRQTLANNAVLDELHQRWASLTPREQEVLTLIAVGKLNKQVAADLGTVEQTVKVHRARGMAKMKLRSVAELVRLMEQVGG